MTPNLRKLRWLFVRPQRAAELEEELRFHLEEEAEEHGYDAARRQLGNIGLIQEDTRAMWGWVWLEQLFQDLRYASRTMLKNPAFTALATLSLALGIGANTAIYSFMDAVMMRWLPVRDPGSLALLQWHTKHGLDDSVVQTASGHFDDDSKLGRVGGIFPYPAFEQLRKSKDVFSSLFAYRPARNLTVMIAGGAQVANGEYVSGDFFRGLGVVPEAGRLLDANDDHIGTGVVALGYGFAQRHFGDASRAPGQKIFLNNVPFTVSGVTPPGFYGVDLGSAPDFYLPLHADVALTPVRWGKSSPTGGYLDRHYYWMEIMGRLRPGITLQQAQVQIGPVFQNWVVSTAENDAQRANLPQFLVSAGARGVDRLRRNFEEPLGILMAMVALILAIACANIANLLLARAAARRGEIALRLSIGAGRWRVIRQLLTESVLLAFVGACGGVLVAYWSVPVLRAMLTGGSEFVLRAELNGHVLAATAALTMVTGLVFGLAPALQSTRVDTVPALKQWRTAEPRRGLPVSLSQLLIIAQIAISLVLIAVAGLFVRTLANLQSLDVGFTREKVLVFQLNAGQAGHQSAELLSFYRGLAQRFSTIPGVISVAEANSPLIGDGAWGWAVVPLGKPKPEHAPSGHGTFGGWENTHTLQTDAHFLSTMKIPLIAGRGFDERDRAGSAPVAIVNEAWAKANLGGRNAVGERVVSFGIDDKPIQMSVIGVTRNALYNRIEKNFPATVYLPLDQNLGAPVEEMSFFLRTTGDPLRYAGAVREIVRKADARIPVTHLGTQEQRIQTEIGDQILFARLSAGFALLALSIATVGLYGTMSYVVARRTGEIGIRVALGADRGRVLLMILRQVAILAAVGLAIGLPLTFAASRLVESLLYGLKAGDPVTTVIAVLTILVAVIAAGYLPARRASQIDPMIALRHE